MLNTFSGLPPELDEEQIKLLAGKSAGDYSPTLQSLGHYFSNTLPSALDSLYVLRVEQLLNNLYKEITRVSFPPLLLSDKRKNAVERMQQIMGLIGSMSDAVKLGEGGPRPPDFFSQAKQLGVLLLEISQLLE